jgi:hypothetical protein
MVAVSPPPHLSDVELAEGTSSDLALALRDAIARNAGRPEAREALTKLNCRVLVRAEDTDAAVTLDFAGGRTRIADGEQDSARVRVLGDEDAILALTRVPFAHGIPEVWKPAGRHALKRQLGGELTIRGLVLRSRSVMRLLRVLSA